MKLEQIIANKEQNRHNLYLLLYKSSELPKVLDVFMQYGIKSLDIGKTLAKELQGVKVDKFISLTSHELLDRIIEENTCVITGSNVKSLVVYNLGILLEPVLGLKPEQILKDISKTTVLILLWEDNIDENILYWTSQKDSYNLDFSDIDLKIIEIDYEV
jgi:hypothetical protein